MRTHISDKDIKNNVLMENPIPSNIKKIPKLDSYIKILLQSKKRFSTLKIEKTFKMIHDMVLTVYGPLSKIWEVLDEEKRQNPKSSSRGGYMV